MRWDSLFGDLDAQWHAATQEELERQVNELARIELAQTRFSEGLRGSVGEPVAVTLTTGVVHHGTVRRVEPEWLLLQEESRFLLIPLTKVVKVLGMGPGRRAGEGRVTHSLAAALRVLARNRAAVLLELHTQPPSAVRGVIDHVGADFLAVAQMADGVSRVGGNRQGNVVVPFEGLLAIMSSAENEL